MRILFLTAVCSLVIFNYSFAQNNPALDTERLIDAKMLVEYFDQMSIPKPLLIRQGRQFEEHRRQLRQKLLECAGLSPLPHRVPLDIHKTRLLEHPWCTIQRIYYQLWPGVYSSGLLYMPKEFSEKPAPIMLCPHGHWENGNANPMEQTRCLVFAKMGYIVFAPNQNHYEDLNLGISDQTVNIWSNMRALDFLQSLPEADPNRIGVCGYSGGGLQTERLLALDNRVKAATIAGMACEIREILFPHWSHCTCNHYPNVMRFTDSPEISTLGFPVPVQYLTMNDWTRNFCLNNFPRIKLLYAVNGAADKVECSYEPLEHIYGKSPREHTYRWMEKWLRDKPSGPFSEPNDVQTFAPQQLLNLALPEPNDRDCSGISAYYQNTRHYKIPKLVSPKDIRSYCSQMLAQLKYLLGEDFKLPKASSAAESFAAVIEDNLCIEKVSFPSEGTIRVPTIILRRKDVKGKLPVTIVCDAAGKDTIIKSDSVRQLTEQGRLVVVPDVRFFGQLSLETLAKEISPLLMKFNAAKVIVRKDDEEFAPKYRTTAWERNSIVWGRSLTAMACTDIAAVLDGLAARPDADVTKTHITTHNSGALAIAAVFAAALDNRITSIDVDFQNCCYENRKLPPLAFVLQYGDVLQWLSLLNNRKVTIRNLPQEAGDTNWLENIFTLSKNPKGLSIVPNRAGATAVPFETAIPPNGGFCVKIVNSK